ncbi:MAG TPA: hypothetical protein VME63_05440 [Dyella sp.]|uniref:hypothetical protein n=1 Tax=Dyella sp. TaxID=1869338 RepID=UPI002C67E4A0|nr:hypothetical protein [Dyella sp.]HTV84825.1 hypothetical protein [Dyella sp.]
MMWLVLRLALVLAAILGSITYPDQTSAPPFMFWVIATLVVATSVFGFLCVVDRRRAIDKGSPYLWTSPFYPQSRYPAQQFVLIGYLFTLVGAIRTVLPLYTQHRLVGTSLCLAIGASMLTAVWAWRNFFSNPPSQKKGAS